MTDNEFLKGRDVARNTNNMSGSKPSYIIIFKPSRSHPPSIVTPHGVLVRLASLEVQVEAVLDVEDLPDVLHAERLALVDGQRLRGADRVLDLPAVEVVLREALVVVVAEGTEVDPFENADALDKDAEDGLLGPLREALVAQGDVDARLECVVKGLSSKSAVTCERQAKNKGRWMCTEGERTYLDSVRRQEQDPLEVLQLPQEDADQRVAGDLVQVPLLEEHVGLVEEEDGAPGVADVEDLLQLRLEVSRVGAQLSGRGHVERALEQLADALGCERLSRARGPMEYGYIESRVRDDEKQTENDV